MQIKEEVGYSWKTEVEKMVELVKTFLILAEELLISKVITKAQYDEITYNKIEFLKCLERNHVQKNYAGDDLLD